MQAFGIAIDHEPRQTHDAPPHSEQRTAEEAAHERAERRIKAVEQFQKGAQASTLAQMAPLVTQLIAMCVQLRALGGTGYATNLPNKLREAADFLEDL